MKFFWTLILFVVSLSFGAWDGVTATIPANIIDTSFEDESYVWRYKAYVISTPEELAWLAQEVNSGNKFKDIDIVLGDDIIFGDDTSKISEYKWTPIGHSSEMPFKGSFYGNGHTIYGLNMDGAGDSLAGLFGYIHKDGFVYDVTVANFNLAIDETVYDDTEEYYAGAVVAYSDKGGTWHLRSRGGKFSIKDKQDLSSKRTVYLGGVIGYKRNNNLDSSFSSNEIVVSAYSKVYLGGVVGLLTSDYPSKASLNKSTFSGKIDFTDLNGNESVKSYIGGLVGMATGYSSSISSCINYGSINANSSYVGGISGNAKVSSCENRGDVSSTDGYAGGIVVEGSCQKSQNYGAVSGKYAGGISYSSSINCTNYGEVNGDVLAAGLSVICNPVRYSMNRGAVYGDSAAGICVKVDGIVSTSLSITEKVKGKSATAGIAVLNNRYAYNCYYDSTLLKNVKSIWKMGDTASFDKMMGISSEKMQSAAFVNDLNFDIERENTYCQNNLVCESRRTFEWGFDGQYPVASDDTTQPLWNIYRDDGTTLELTFADAKGHVINLDPAYSSQGHYFVGWVDSLGNRVTKTTVFKNHGYIYAEYSDKIADPTLIVYDSSTEQTVEPWDGSEKMPTYKVRRDSNVYHVINTPAELAWFVNHMNVYITDNAILGKDIVLGKDSSSITDFYFKKRNLEGGISYEGTDRGSILDGDGHTIYGLNQPLFTKIDFKSVVRNVNFANFNLHDSSGVVAIENRGFIENCTTRGVIVDSGVTSVAPFVRVNAWIIDSCVNYSNLNVVSKESNPVAISGIANENVGRISRSVNYGNISVAAGSSGSVDVAGITVKYYRTDRALADSAKGILYCENKGDISVKAREVRVGGILASCIDLTSCLGVVKNEGDIFISPNKGGTVEAGGIVVRDNQNWYGYHVVADSAVNTGNIEVVVKDRVSSLNLAGIGVYSVVAKNSRNEGNITIVDSTTQLDYIPNMVVGGIVADYGTVDSSVNAGNISFVMRADYDGKDVTLSSDVYFGGIGGRGLVASNSVNEGRVSAIANVGGISGHAEQLKNVTNKGFVSARGLGLIDSYVGGISGICDTLDGVFNKAAVKFNSFEGDTSSSYVGGVCGYADGRSGYYGDYVPSRKRISNSASVTNNGTNEKSYAGGIFGYMHGYLYDAYNRGPVKSFHFAGGIFGQSSLLGIKNVYDASTLDAPMMLAIGGTTEFDEVKKYTPMFDTTALVYVDTTLFKDSVYRVHVEHRTYSYINQYPCVLMESVDMKSDEFLNILNTSNGKRKDEGIWVREDGYPYLNLEPKMDGYSSFEEEDSSSSTENRFSSSSANVSSSSSVQNVSSSSEAQSNSSSSETPHSSSSSSEKDGLIHRNSVPSFAVNVQNRDILLLNVREGRSYELFDMQGNLVTKGVVGRSTEHIRVDRAGSYVLRVGFASKLVVVR